MPLRPTCFEFSSQRNYLNYLNSDLPPAHQHVWGVTIQVALDDIQATPSWRGKISVETESSSPELAKQALVHALRQTILELEKS